MPRFLALDWDHQQLRVVEAAVQGAKVVVRRAVSWPETISPNPADPEAAGQALRARLKEVGIAPAPVLAAVGRDRLIVRDIRYPEVPPAEVPFVVRFQAIKELTFPAEEGVIDYSLVSIPWPSGERRALANALRKELLTAYTKLCQSAGLRLQAVTPRPYGLAASWQAWAAVAHEDDAEAVAVFAPLGDGSGELCVIRKGELLLSRAVSAPTESADSLPLLPELRRSLVAYAGQYPHHPVRRLFIAGRLPGGSNEAVGTALRLPVASFDPLPGVPPTEVPPEQRGAFAGAYGLLCAHARPPVNFLAPKEPDPTADRRKRFRVAGLAAAAVLLLLISGGVFYGVESAAREDRIAALRASNANLQKQITAQAEMEKRLEALNTWAGGEMVMLDELYELFARFPDQPGVRITKVSWTPTSTTTSTAAAPRPGQPAKPTAAAASTAKKAPAPIGTLIIEATADSRDKLEALRLALDRTPHWKLELWERDIPAPNQVRATLKVFRLEPKDYRAVLTPPKNQTATGGKPDKPRQPGGRRP